MTDSAHLRAFESLRNVKVRDFRPAVKLKEAVLLKTGAFRRGQFHDEECERHARFFVRLIEDVLGGIYGDLTLRAFTHACSALDYLMNPNDELEDHGPRGLEDDAKRLRDTFENFRGEFEAYREWLRQREAEAAGI